jgi:bifunctional N-acetylglucosamine-1-phosphate-uridyltransferase/glucosamine-1-phosphate-acetyltransferase GlmU-like protein
VKRLLVIPAAGLGSRLGSATPKVLHPICGRPFLDHLIDLYQPVVDRIVLVIHPGATEAIATYCADRALDLDVAIQPQPSGMLPALLVPRDLIAAHQPLQVWATWCDQIAIHPLTVARLAALCDADADAALAFPTAWRAAPYIHFARDRQGTIIDVLQQREGDVLPARGESDAGLFAFSRAAYCDHLPVYARTAVPGAGTGEANFLPFIPWLAAQLRVRTFSVVDEIEAVGINTVEDLRRVEGYLRERH